MEKSEPGVVLGDNDIFFVDIGPIYGDTEGDAGDTFVVGDDPDHLRAKKGGPPDLGRGARQLVRRRASTARSSTTSPSRRRPATAGS